MFLRKGVDESTQRTEDVSASAGDFFLFDDTKHDPFVFDDDAFGLYDAHGIHRRQYSTSSLSTSDGITVVRGRIPSLSNTSRPHDDAWGTSANCTGRFLNNLWFKRILLAVIIAQSVIVAISTTDYVTSDEELSKRFWTARQGFLYLFTIELLLRLIRYRFRIIKSGWLIFDVLVIGGSWILPQLLVLRTFRVLRSLRHATRFHQIRDLTLALGRSIPKAMSIVYFLVIIFYVFGVIFTSNYKYDFDEFRRLDTTMFTLFQVMTLDQWSELARRVMEDHSWAWLPFCAFISVSTLFVVNFIVAIMIQGLVPIPNVIHDEDLIIGQTDSLDARRLEAKVDQLLGIVEAIRQKQNHMDSLVASMRSSSTPGTMTASETATLPTTQMNSFEDSTRTETDSYNVLLKE